jgi:outer membrane protein TolC
VTVAYYQVLLARRLVTVASDVLQEAQSFEQRMRLLEQGGEAARADVVQASSQVAIYRQALSNAELQAQLANMDLASFWTTDVTDHLDLVDTFDQPPGITDTGGLGPAPYLNRPEFSLLDAQRRGFEADARAIRAQLLPQTSIIWQYGVDMNRVNFNEHGQAAMFAVTVPVFDWFRTRDLAAQSRVRADQLATQRRIAERTYSRDYQNALARLSTLFQQISFTQQQIAVAEDNLRLSQLKYQGGEGLPLEVLTAQTQVGQARGAYFTALASYHVAQTDLEVAAAQ